MNISDLCESFYLPMSWRNVKYNETVLPGFMSKVRIRFALGNMFSGGFNGWLADYVLCAVE